jgi:GntR family transcriptional regulator, carbon starvation induced regulator
MQSTAKPTQAETVCRLIRAEILDGRLPAGEKLNIGVLEKRFEVSLGAIREALSGLSAEGLVIAESQRGYRVTPISSAELLDLTRTRVDVESLCLRRSMQLGDVDWEARIIAAAHRMERLQVAPSEPAARLTSAWSLAHAEFHEALVSACPSPWLLRLRKMLHGQSERYRRLSVPLEMDNRDVPGEHRRLMQAVLQRDEPEALLALEAHFSATTEFILKSPLLNTANQNALPSQSPASSSTI